MLILNNKIIKKSVGKILENLIHQQKNIFFKFYKGIRESSLKLLIQQLFLMIFSAFIKAGFQAAFSKRKKTVHTIYRMFTFV